MVCIVFIQNGAEDVTQYDNFIEKPQQLKPDFITDPNYDHLENVGKIFGYSIITSIQPSTYS